MSHEHHVDIEEEPGTYKSNWACGLAIILGLLDMAYGAQVVSPVSHGLGTSSLVVGGLVVLLMGARLFVKANKLASIAVILLGIYSWYSAHFFGIDPVVGDMTNVGYAGGEIGFGIFFVFLGTWTAIGAPNVVEHEPFFYKIEQ